MTEERGFAISRHIPDFTDDRSKLTMLYVPGIIN
jgi:hypothetical protein